MENAIITLSLDRYNELLVFEREFNRPRAHVVVDFSSRGHRMVCTDDESVMLLAKEVKELKKSCVEKDSLNEILLTRLKSKNIFERIKMFLNFNN